MTVERKRSIDLEAYTEEEIEQMANKVAQRCSDMILDAKKKCNEFLAPFGLSLLVKIEFSDLNTSESSSQDK